MDYQIIDLNQINCDTLNIWEECDRMVETVSLDTQCGIAVKLNPGMKIGVGLLHWLEKWQKLFVSSGKRFFIIAENSDQQECIEFSHPDLNFVYFSSLEGLVDAFPVFMQKTEQSGEALPDVNVPESDLQCEQSIEITELGQTQAIESNGFFDNVQEMEEKQVAEQKQSSVFIEKNIEQEPIEQKIPVKPDKVRMDTLQSTISEPTGFCATSGSDKKVDDMVEQPDSGPVSSEIFTDGDRIDIAGEYRCRGCGTSRMYIKGDISGICDNPECPFPELGWELWFELF